MELSNQILTKVIQEGTVSLKKKVDLKPLIDELSQARVVMLGESTHGTQEFYEWRRLISEWLIVKHGFNFIAVEGDWPPCSVLNDFIHSRGGDSARETLIQFNRWPTWMWANTEVIRLLEWMKTHNSTVPPHQRSGFFGLDVYSLFESMEVVIAQLEKMNPFLARKARVKYECFESFRKDERAYVRFMGESGESCQEEVAQVLQDLLKLESEGAVDRKHILFDARQNARTVVNAERYYRTMIHGSEDSWNVRDRHMLETLDNLLSHYGPESKAIVWAHNSHIGDYRATDMVHQGLVNLGGIAREKWGEDQVALLGFGTNEGKVIASRAWDGPIEVMPVQSGKPDTYEALFHQVSVQSQENCFFLSFKKNPELRRIFSKTRGHRAIGVVYHPQFEHFGNYVPTALSHRYDAFLFLDKTTALEPLVQSFDREEIPETWPMGQ